MWDYLTIRKDDRKEDKKTAHRVVFLFFFSAIVPYVVDSNLACSIPTWNEVLQKMIPLV